MSTHSTRCSKVAVPSGRTSATRHAFSDVLDVSVVWVWRETVARTIERCSTSQRIVSPGWNL